MWREGDKKQNWTFKAERTGIVLAMEEPKESNQSRGSSGEKHCRKPLPPRTGCHDETKTRATRTQNGDTRLSPIHFVASLSLQIPFSDWLLKHLYSAVKSSGEDADKFRKAPPTCFGKNNVAEWDILTINAWVIGHVLPSLGGDYVKDRDME